MELNLNPNLPRTPREVLCTFDAGAAMDVWDPTKLVIVEQGVSVAVQDMPNHRLLDIALSGAMMKDRPAELTGVRVQEFVRLLLSLGANVRLAFTEYAASTGAVKVQADGALVFLRLDGDEGVAAPAAEVAAAPEEKEAAEEKADDPEAKADPEVREAAAAAKRPRLEGGSSVSLAAVQKGAGISDVCVCICVRVCVFVWVCLRVCVWLRKSVWVCVCRCAMCVRVRSQSACCGVV